MHIGPKHVCTIEEMDIIPRAVHCLPDGGGVGGFARDSRQSQCVIKRRVKTLNLTYI